MAWSTSELATLAETTVKTIRHYHSRGLLAEPERAPNGYKRYEIDHLVRLLQIRRLSELGFSLRQIGTMDPSAGDGCEDSGEDGQAAEGNGDSSQRETLRALDRELEISIARQQQMREDIAAILEHGSAVDLPSGFGRVRNELTAADRGLLLVYSRFLDEATLDSMRVMLTEINHTEASRQFQTLSAEAGEQERADLARRFGPEVRDVQERYGWSGRLGEIPHHRRREVDEMIGKAMNELYNPAQIDVLVRMEPIIAAKSQQGT
ncbi:MerR family transcriptional regulator [Brevibacterium oceani]|uniref:MerR family transcriptional regulator n=1 Tax=Brevibacterium oceani TaxID=358099 RepID=UPI001B319BA2|nr:MerR family transcriptional regulator [Brevibacterium oceani]